MNIFKLKYILLPLLLSGCDIMKKKEETNKEINSSTILKNNNFTTWSKGNELISHDNDIIIPDYWRIKTRNGPIYAECTKSTSGIYIDAYYEEYGYLYIRQLIPNVMNYSNKEYEIEISINNLITEEVLYDLYIQARLNENNNERVLVIDTKQFKLKEGKSILKLTFNVPNLENVNYLINNNNALSVAFRIIGQKEQSIQFEIDYIKIKEI
jgi:hypothetical protein